MVGHLPLAFLALVLGACASKPGHFKNPREEFLATTRTLLDFPLEGPEFRAEDLARIDLEVKRLLEAYDYRIVEGGVLEDLDRGVADVDSILIKGLVLREAYFDFEGAEWDGVRREIELPSGGLYGLDEDLEGYLGALSLYVCITRPGGEIQFESVGGVGLLQRWNGSEFENVGPTSLLADEDAVQAAVETALAPLAR
ncbi:MAG: hypothetical protein CMJ89_08215 [Planctomycetes bacterium]|jgi:hypothetical protein|nr:hypothetical protein [Planctomycetota bacterium]